MSNVLPTPDDAEPSKVLSGSLPEPLFEQDLPPNDPFTQINECPLCLVVPEKVNKKFFSSSEQSWDALAGHEGWVLYCSEHPEEEIGIEIVTMN